MEEETYYDAPPLQLYRALIAAKKQFGPIVANKKNSHFKNEYLDLSGLLAIIEQPLLDAGVYIQFTTTDTSCVLTLYHLETGEQERSALKLFGENAQQYGGSLTYAKRYLLTAMLNLTIDPDDDGNTAVGRPAAPTDVAPRASGKRRLM